MGCKKFPAPDKWQTSRLDKKYADERLTPRPRSPERIVLPIRAVQATAIWALRNAIPVRRLLAESQVMIDRLPFATGRRFHECCHLSDDESSV